MPHQAIFQTMPTHIIRCIINYIGWRPDFKAMALVELAHTCHRWRLACLEILYGEQIVNITKSDVSVCNIGPWQGPSQHGSWSNRHHAKTLVVQVESWLSILNGTVSNILASSFSNKPGGESTFCNARRLVFNIGDGGADLTNSVVDGFATSECAIWAACLVRRFVPNVCAVEVKWNSPAFLVNVPGIDGFATHLFTRLSQGLKQIEYAPISNTLDIKLGIGKLEALTEIKYGRVGNMQPLLAIVRHSASTLRVLEINSLAAAEIPALFTDRAHQTAISYPQLKTFIVGQYPIFGRPTSELMAEIPGYKRFIPFPNLRRLCVNGCYAFDNDLLLRSNNGGTLERLSLPIDQCFTEMAAKQQIFREKMFSNLASISLTIGGREFPVTARLKADAACLALDVVAASKDASVEHLKLDGLFNSSVLIQGISQRVDGFLGIKVLELPKMRLDFAEIADILGQLQMLRRLRCALSGKASNMLDESIDVNSDKNASESCKAWCAGAGRVLNPNFESLQLTPTTKCSMGVIALWLSFLYTVCPRLHRVGMGMVDLKNACKDAVC